VPRGRGMAVKCRLVLRRVWISLMTASVGVVSWDGEEAWKRGGYR
jgi:hypothetical protein